MSAAHKSLGKVTLALMMLFIVLSMFVSHANPSEWTDPEMMSFDQLVPEPQVPERVELSNGLVVYLLVDDTLPLVQGTLYLRAGGLFDPDAQTGLASLTATMLREGGTSTRTPDELDEALEFLAASVESSAGTSFATVSFSALSENTEDVLSIFHDVVLNPAFDEGRLEVEKGGLLEGIRRQNDDPVGIAQREFLRLVADGHPQGRFETEDSINSIDIAAMRNFHQTYYVPNGSYLAVSGDIDTEEIVASLEAAFADWPAQDVTYPEVAPFPLRPEGQVYFIPRETAQSVIFIGHPSVYAYTPAYNELDVANGILGGEGFSSRITTEVRTRRGLAYSTGSGVTQGYDAPGIFFAYSLSRGDATLEVIDALLGEIRNFQEGGVSVSELERQQATTLNRAVFRFVSPAAVAERTARAEMLGLAADYYETYINNLQTVTPEDIQTISQTELRPDEAIIVVVGDPEQFGGADALEVFGDVIIIDVDADDTDGAYLPNLLTPSQVSLQVGN
ncbi:MAG: pitrilysin family protein [Deinococcota bacterium]